VSSTLQSWIPALEKELKDNILSFWMSHTIDDENGGFYGEIGADLSVRKDADKSLVLNTRILWTFATAYRVYKDEQYRSIADRAYEYLTSRFTDVRFGGMYWMVDSKGEPVNEKKQVYGQAFAVYALSEYHRATGHAGALEQAIQIFRLIEKHAYDPVDKGYWEALSRDWKPLEDYSLSHHGGHAKKTMNTHLHVMEAFTNLLRVWPADELKAKQKELIEVTASHIVIDKTAQFALYFDQDWKSQSDHITFGHDIEGSWLLVEAAEVLGDEPLLRKVKAISVRMAEAALTGVDTDGGMWNEADSTGLINRNKDWWPQAEAMVGFYNAYQLSHEDKYLQAARRSWQFIDRFMTDKEHGEWYWSVAEDGTPLNGTLVNAWKCPYHNSRACFEMIERLQHQTG
jgi:mannobiose 2-epimerase